jgi:hypothetical protein
MDLVSMKVSMKFENPYFPPGHLPGPGDYGFLDTFPFTETSLSAGKIILCWKPAKPVALIYELKFRTQKPTLVSDNEIVFIKTVAIDRPVVKLPTPPWKPSSVRAIRLADPGLTVAVPGGQVFSCRIP